MKVSHQFTLIKSVFVVLTYVPKEKKSMLGSILAKGFGESSVVSNSNSNSVVMGMWNMQKFNAYKSLS